MCQTPLGGIVATKTSRPLANWGGDVERSDGDHELALEVVVDVGRPQLASRAEPARVQLATAHELALLDVEDVGEIRQDRDLDRQPDGPRGVVDEVVVLVDAIGDGPVQAQAQRLPRDRPEGIDEGVVGELVARREELDRRRAEEDRAVRPLMSRS